MFAITEASSRISTKARAARAENLTPLHPFIRDITTPDTAADMTRVIRAKRGIFSVEFSEELAIKAKIKATITAEPKQIPMERAKLTRILFSARFIFIKEKTSKISLLYKLIRRLFYL